MQTMSFRSESNERSASQLDQSVGTCCALLYVCASGMAHEMMRANIFRRFVNAACTCSYVSTAIDSDEPNHWCGSEPVRSASDTNMVSVASIHTTDTSVSSRLIP